MSKEYQLLEDRIRNIASFYEIEAYEGSPEVWDQTEHLLDMTEADISLAIGRLP